MKRHFNPLNFSRYCLVSVLFLLVNPLPLLADGSSFYPTWKLLNRQEKQHFIAGYLQGWKAAAQVTQIATQYIKENPEKAIKSLESLQSVYRTAHVSPDTLVPLLDTYYSDPENQDASLSFAISAARNLMPIER